MSVQIELSANQISSLENLEKLTGKSRSELLGLALDKFLADHLTELVPPGSDLDSFLENAKKYQQAASVA